MNCNDIFGAVLFGVEFEFNKTVRQINGSGKWENQKLVQTI
jgi:hypothetical protein